MVEPFTAQKPLGSDNPRDLWKYMAAYEAKTGGKALAIAHNGNGSNGRMFPIIESFTGKKIDREYAENRRRWEPLYEVTQMKGTSEAHPFLSPNDEFASFEIWDKGNLDVSAAKKPEMLEFEYARSAFKNGLKMEGALGINPYKFGLVGSTDSHTALAAVEEDNFFGKTSGSEPSADARRASFHQEPGYRHHRHGLGNDRVGLCGRLGHREHARSDLGCDGAPRNLRHHRLTDDRALLRRLGFRSEGCAQNRAAGQRRLHQGRADGRRHQRGADAARPRPSSSPRSRTPIGANLDRIQIIKGWLDAKGQTQEKVYDVVWSDSATRKPDANGQAAGRRQYRRCGERDLDQHDRRLRS